MGTRLYVGNLSSRVDNAALEEMFAQYGQVTTAEVISEHDTGRSKGFGFVEMADDEGAQAAIAGLDGKDHQGRALKVNEARPKEDRPRGGGGGGGYGGGGGGRGGGGGGFNRDYGGGGYGGDRDRGGGGGGYGGGGGRGGGRGGGGGGGRDRY